MKKYVFISRFIGGVGGGQMYVRNKMLYLRDNGWSVNVISCNSKNIMIPELREFGDNDFLPIFPMYFLSKQKQNIVLRKIIDVILDGTYEQIIIESNFFNGSLWAEIVSQQIGARHISYPLGERLLIENKGMRSFLKFKHQRRELVGITPNSLISLFAPFYAITHDQSYWLPAYCNNVEADVDNPFIHKIDKTKYDFIVGCLSRLTKPFVEAALNDFCRFADAYKTKRFLLIFMGDSTEDPPRAKKIRQTIISKTSNVELIITGYLFPVPTRLLEMCNAFFTSAGSGWVCARSGVPTIVYDAQDLRPIGILGRTTNNCLFRSSEEPILSFDTLLNGILFEKKYPIVEPSYNNNIPDFESHIEFINKAEKSLCYFDISSIHIESAKERFLSVLGENVYKWFKSIKL